jgi:hypothetical protein
METSASSGRTKRIFHRKSIATIDAIEYVKRCKLVLGLQKRTKSRKLDISLDISFTYFQLEALFSLMIKKMLTSIEYFVCKLNSVFSKSRSINIYNTVDTNNFASS